MKINLPETGQERIVIVGGGFAGLTLARKLAKSQYQVVLIDKNNYHQFQPLLYQVAMAGLSPSDIAVPIRSLLSGYSNVRVLMGNGKRVDADKKKLICDIGEFDYTVFFPSQQTAVHYNVRFGAHSLRPVSVPH